MPQNAVLPAADRPQHPDAAEDIEWHHPSRPIQICLKGGVGPSLAQQALAGLKNQNPSEIGGLLFGNAETRGPEVRITLTTALFVGGKGPYFNSAPEEDAPLMNALENNSNPESKPIGYFRSDIRNQSSLTPQDKEFIVNNLPIPNSVSLLIRPSRTGVCMVGVFLWKNNRLLGEFTDFAMPLFSSEPQNSSDSVLSTDPPAVALSGVSAETEIRKSEAGPAAERVSVSLRRGAKPAKAEERKVTTNVLLGLLLAATVCLCALIVGLIGFLSHRSALQPAQPAVLKTTAPEPVSKQAAPGRSLGLQVNRPAPDQLNVTWDRQLPRDAIGGLLDIVDGPNDRFLTLDSAQLRLGKLTYFSKHSDISFRFDVLSSNGSISSEYIRVLGTVGPRVPGPGSATKPQPSGSLVAEQDGALGNAKAVDLVKVLPAAPQPKSVVVPAAIPDTLPALPGNQPELAMTPAPEQPPALLTAPEPRQGPVPKEEAKPVPSGTGLIRPQPLQRVMPNVRDIYPNGFPSAMRVAVDVSVGPNGKVTAASTSARFGLLSDACVSAAKQWRFAPALQNHEPVASRYQIVFVFNARK